MMRARHGEIRPEDKTFTVTFEGRPLVARSGESVAATLVAHGITGLRVTASGAERGLYCGMGVCQDCLVEIDGRPNQRACMTPVTGPLAIKRQTSPASLAPPPEVTSSPLLPPSEPDVLVVGGGAGGLTAAAVAAEAGASVVLIDERPAPGGQFYKQPLGAFHLGDGIPDDPQFAGGRALIERARLAGVVRCHGVVASAALPLEVMAVIGGRTAWIRPKRLIVAAGAYERPWPVPGWTLPGVMTTGAAQTLLRSYRVLAGRRILLAGNGPLNLQVARELHQAGAEVVGIVEAAPRPSPRQVRPIAAMALSAAHLLWQGIGYARDLGRARIPLHYAAVVTRIEAVSEGLVATLSNGQKITADRICLGYGFLPSNELLRILGCRVAFDAALGHLRVLRDRDCRTSVDDVFAVGDCCGLGGAFAAQAEGVLAGIASATTVRSPERAAQEARARRTLQRHRRFQRALWSLFRPATVMPVPERGTLVCRCEEVDASGIADAQALPDIAIGTVKRRTRLGMGRCQGRYCGQFAAERSARLAGRSPVEADFPAPRPPVKPVEIGAMANVAEGSK